MNLIRRLFLELTHNVHTHVLFVGHTQRRISHACLTVFRNVVTTTKTVGRDRVDSSRSTCPPFQEAGDCGDTKICKVSVSRSRFFFIHRFVYTRPWESSSQLELAHNNTVSKTAQLADEVSARYCKEITLLGEVAFACLKQRSCNYIFHVALAVFSRKK